MKRRIIALIAGGSALVVAGAAVVAVVTGDPQSAVTASSSAQGMAPSALFSADSEDFPETDDLVWQADGETTGAWVKVQWDSPRSVDRLRMSAPPAADAGFATALIEFSDRSTLMVAADEEGKLDVVFPERRVTSARVIFDQVDDGDEAAGLSALVIDGSGDDLPEADDEPRISASSAEDAADAVTDGSAASGSWNEEWSADSDDSSPWIQLDWTSARQISSVQILGPSRGTEDSANPAAPPLHGTLRFSDGSSVVVSGISGGEGTPTTLAFAPRMATSVRLELEKNFDSAPVAVREFAAYEVGVTPPRWPVDPDTVESVEPEESVACTSETEAVGDPDDGELGLVCPAPGTGVSGETAVVVSAPENTTVEAVGWTGSNAGSGEGTMTVLDTATADADGRAELLIDMDQLASGPNAVTVTRSEGGTVADEAPLYVQLDNLGGQSVESPSFAPETRTLQWSDDFTSGVSVTGDGGSSDYAATKPSAWGGSEFGAAIFADPGWGLDNLSVVDDEYLRLRVAPLENRSDPEGWDREHTGAMLSSLHVGGSGFAAQYGYFEARILGAPGRGTWPAFWMLNTESATSRGDDSSGEVDAVELYGHNTTGSCHALHDWQDGEDEPQIRCLDDNGFDDWAMTWHTYGVDVTPEGATYYIDGAEVAHLSGLQFNDQPFFFMMNLALDGGWPVELEPTGNRVDMYVDWVRVYT